jgi:hypothetical protein
LEGVREKARKINISHISQTADLDVIHVFLE